MGKHYGEHVQRLVDAYGQIKSPSAAVTQAVSICKRFSEPLDVAHQGEVNRAHSLVRLELQAQES